MAMPAMKLDVETFVEEERIARLETHVEHMRSDISELRVDVRRLGDKIDDMDKRLCGEIKDGDLRTLGKIDSLKDAMDKGFKAIDDKFAKMNVSRVWDRVWFLLTAAGIFGVMARGFKWI